MTVSGPEISDITVGVGDTSTFIERVRGVPAIVAASVTCLTVFTPTSSNLHVKLVAACAVVCPPPHVAVVVTGAPPGAEDVNE